MANKRKLIGGNNILTEPEGNSNMIKREIQLHSDPKIDKRYFTPQKVKKQATSESKMRLGRPKGENLVLEEKVRQKGMSNSKGDTNISKKCMKRKRNLDDSMKKTIEQSSLKIAPWC